MENSDKPLISVFTCVYNMADKVHRCLYGSDDGGYYGYSKCIYG